MRGLDLLLLIAIVAYSCICIAESSGDADAEVDECEVKTDSSLEGADPDSVLQQFSDQCEIDLESFQSVEFTVSSCYVKIIKTYSAEFIQKVKSGDVKIEYDGKTVECTGARRRRKSSGSGSGSGSGGSGSGETSTGSSEGSGSGGDSSTGDSESSTGDSESSTGSSEEVAESSTGSGEDASTEDPKDPNAVPPGWCFSGDSTVVTPTGPMKIQDLQMDDLVGVIRGHATIQYEPVWWFTHRVTDKPAEFLRIQTEGNNVLELSESHLIPVVPCDLSISEQETDTLIGDNSVFAKRVNPGDCVLSMDVAQSKMSVEHVVSIEKVEKMGYYSPVTPVGNLLVGNVAASCYSQLESHSMQHVLFNFMREVVYSMSGVAKVLNTDGEIPTVLRLLHYAGSMVLSA
jgi:hypothetical protein